MDILTDHKPSLMVGLVGNMANSKGVVGTGIRCILPSIVCNHLVSKFDSIKYEEDICFIP